MPRKKKRPGPPMSEAATAGLKASDKGSYYKQAALLDTEKESDRPRDPPEKSATRNTPGIMLGESLHTHHPQKSGNKARVARVCVCACVCELYQQHRKTLVRPK